MYRILLSCFLLTSAHAADQTMGVTYCPQPADLSKDKHMMWGDDPWEGDSPSFSEHATAFIGATWQGVNVGTITCSYRGDNSADFPIQIVDKDHLYQHPDGINKIPASQGVATGAWQDVKGDDGDLLYCRSSEGEVSDCPLLIKVKDEQDLDVHDILQSVDKQGVS